MMRCCKGFVSWLTVFLCLTVAPGFVNGRTQNGERASRLVVSFYSICCGIDRKAQERLDEFVAGYERTTGKQLAKQKGYWGKEGEIDYCFGLSELSARERRRFIYRVRQLLKSSQLVHIKEHGSCRNER